MRPVSDILTILATGLQEPGVNLTREQAYDQKRCVKCGGEARSFRDMVTSKEYRLTIWCQKCQDDFFGE